MKKTLLALLSGAMMLMAMSCSSKKESTVTLDLESNPTTGAEWVCSIADESVAVLADSSYKQNEAEEGMVGVGGVQTLTFKCLKAGTTDLTLTYGRNVEGGETFETKNATLTVDKKLKGSITFADEAAAEKTAEDAEIEAEEVSVEE